MVLRGIGPVALLAMMAWLGMVFYWVVRSAGNGILREIAGLLKLAVSGLVLFIPLFVRLPFSIYPLTWARQMPGLLAVMCGGLLCVVARECLATNWSGKVVVRNNHALIDNGPYRYVRHPMYAGVLLMMLGSAIVAGNALCLLWTLFCFFGLLRKSLQEEALLARALGPAYARYQQRTRMLIPRVL